MAGRGHCRLADDVLLQELNMYKYHDCSWINRINQSNRYQHTKLLISAILISVITQSAQSQSIVGNWKCTNASGFETIMILNADGSLTARTILGQFLGTYSFDGRNFVYTMSVGAVRSRPVVNIIYRIEQSAFYSYPQSNPNQREVCQRVVAADLPAENTRGPSRPCTLERGAICESGNCMNGPGVLRHGNWRLSGNFSNCLIQGGNGTFEIIGELTYTGELKFTPEAVGPNGQGRMVFYGGPNHCVAEGHFKDGLLDGFGKLTYTAGPVNGKMIEGIFRKGQPESGKITFPGSEGGIYEGQIVNLMPHGRGILKYNNGNEFEGNFVSGHFEGYGIFTYANGDSYEGEFKEGAFCGQGVFHWSDGTKYVGHWENGKQHGSGTEYAADGSIVYQGDYIYGEMAGQVPATSDPPQDSNTKSPSPISQ